MGNRYQFRLKGLLDESWADWLSDMSIDHQRGGTTLITGRVADQAALYGILAKLRDLRLDLLSLERMEIKASKDKENSNQNFLEFN